MKYNDIIVLRITDFQRHFNFSDFWKYRNFFTDVVDSPRFFNKSSDKMTRECANVIKSWLSNDLKRYSVAEEASLIYSDKNIGQYSTALVKKIDELLQSDKLNCDKERYKLVLASLYHMYDEGIREKMFDLDRSYLETDYSLRKFRYVPEQLECDDREAIKIKRQDAISNRSADILIAWLEYYNLMNSCNINDDYQLCYHGEVVGQLSTELVHAIEDLLSDDDGPDEKEDYKLVIAALYHLMDENVRYDRFRIDEDIIAEHRVHRQYALVNNELICTLADGSIIKNMVDPSKALCAEILRKWLYFANTLDSYGITKDASLIYSDKNIGQYSTALVKKIDELLQSDKLNCDKERYKLVLASLYHMYDEGIREKMFDLDRSYLETDYSLRKFRYVPEQLECDDREAIKIKRQDAISNRSADILIAWLEYYNLMNSCNINDDYQLCYHGEVVGQLSTELVHAIEDLLSDDDGHDDKEDYKLVIAALYHLMNEDERYDRFKKDLKRINNKDIPTYIYHLLGTIVDGKYQDTPCLDIGPLVGYSIKEESLRYQDAEIEIRKTSSNNTNNNILRYWIQQNKNLSSYNITEDYKFTYNNKPIGEFSHDLIDAIDSILKNCTESRSNGCYRLLLACLYQLIPRNIRLDRLNSDADNIRIMNIWDKYICEGNSIVSNGNHYLIRGNDLFTKKCKEVVNCWICYEKILQNLKDTSPHSESYNISKVIEEKVADWAGTCDDNSGDEITKIVIALIYQLCYQGLSASKFDEDRTVITKSYLLSMLEYLPSHLKVLDEEGNEVSIKFDDTTPMNRLCLKIMNAWFELCKQLKCTRINNVCKLKNHNETCGYFNDMLVQQVNAVINTNQNIKDIVNGKLKILSLYSLLKSDKQVEQFNADIDEIIRTLTNQECDFTQDYLEFKDEAREMRVSINSYKGDTNNVSTHIVTLRNLSQKFKVHFYDSESNETIFRIDEEGIALGLFTDDGYFMENYPDTAENSYGKLSLIRDDSKLCLIHEHNGVVSIKENIVSFSSDDNGYCYIVKDSYKPILFKHSYFDQDEIRYKLKSRLSKNEYPLHVEIKGRNLIIRTNRRVVKV